MSFICARLPRMARNQKNFDNFLYIDDNAVHWTKRGEAGGDASAIDGHATNDGSPMWIDTARRKARTLSAYDPTTFRTIKPIIYTPTAYAAVAIGDTIAVQVEGLATTVDYTVNGKNAEKQPKIQVSRKLADA
jgi:hypothetical protein